MVLVVLVMGLTVWLTVKLRYPPDLTTQLIT